MSKQDILTRLAAIIADMVSVPIEEITPEKTLILDLEIDSLSSVELMVFIQDEFKCKVTDEVMGKFVTLGDVIDFVEEETAKVPA